MSSDLTLFSYMVLALVGRGGASPYVRLLSKRRLSGKKINNRQMQTTSIGTSVNTRLRRSKRRCMK